MNEWTCDECKYKSLPAYSYPCCECHEGSQFTEEGSEDDEHTD